MEQVEGADGTHQQEGPPLREPGFQRRVGPASAAPQVGGASARAPNARVPEAIEHGFVLVDGRAHGRGDGGGRGEEWRQNGIGDGRLLRGEGGDEDEDGTLCFAARAWGFL